MNRGYSSFTVPLAVGVKHLTDKESRDKAGHVQHHEQFQNKSALMHKITAEKL